MPPKIYLRGFPTGYDPQAICAYHSRSFDHSTANYWALKHKIQDTIDVEDIVLNRKYEQEPNVSKNSLSEHKGIVGPITINEESSINEIEVGLSQLFIGITYEVEWLEDLEFPTILEGAMQN